MKKNVLRIIAAAVLCVMSIALCCSCGSKGKVGETAGELTLGKYNGVEYTPATVAEVTDVAIDEEIQNQVASYAVTNDVTDRTVKTGDTVNIDYVGKVDGVEFTGGTYAGYNLEIGSGEFISGFEDGLIGAAIGETREVTATFPDPYKQNPELAGKEAVFTVTVNSIKETVYPDITDEFVSENLGYSTAAEYKEAVKETLKKNNESAAKTTDDNAILNAVVDDSEITVYPETYVQEIIDSYITYYTNQATSYGYETLEAFCEDNSVDVDQLKTEIEQQARRIVGYAMIMEAVADAENLSVSEDELNEAKMKYISDAGYDSEDQFKKEKNMSFDDYYKDNYGLYSAYTLELELKIKKAQDFIIEHAVAAQAS